MEAVELAECELESTKQECAEIETRVEKARQMNFDTTKRTRLPLDNQLQASPTAAKEGRVLQATADSDGFSVVSNPQQGATDTGVDQNGSFNASNHFEDDTSDDCLLLLVQRYTDLCHERRMLQEEIEDRLEKRKRTAMENLRLAKIALETMRQKAIETVAALNEASQGESKVNLPDRPVGTTGSKSVFPDADGVYASGSGPIAIPPPLTGNNPTQTREPSIAVPPSKPLTPSITPAPDTIRSAPLDYPLTATQREIYWKYKAMMISAKEAGAAVSMLKIPWPLLMPLAQHYPMQNVMVQHLDDSRVISFIQGYIRWRKWNLKVERKSILTDWEQLLSQVPDYKRGGRLCVEKVVSILRGLLRN